MRRTEYRLPSTFKIILLSLGASCFVFISSLALQWVVYDKWLDRTGRFRITGTLLASILTFLFLWRLQFLARRRQRRMQERLGIIREMNDRIRNALQIIEVTSYVAQPTATEPIREAVDVIDAALREGSTGVVSSETNLGDESCRPDDLAEETGQITRRVAGKI